MRLSTRLCLCTALTLATAAPVAAQDEVTGSVNPSTTDRNAIEAEIIPLGAWQTQASYRAGWSVRDLIGADVYTASSATDQGDVENVLFDSDGNIVSIVAEIGGFFELGDVHVNIPWDQVEYDPEDDHVIVPVTAENVGDYSMFADPLVSTVVAGEDIAEVGGDGAGEVPVGPQIFRATDLLQDYVRLDESGTWNNFGYVDDIIVSDTSISAVVVQRDVSAGAPNAFAYPYYGYGAGYSTRYGVRPGSPYYDLPYNSSDIEGLRPVDETAAMAGS